MFENGYKVGGQFGRAYGYVTVGFFSLYTINELALFTMFYLNSDHKLVGRLIEISLDYSESSIIRITSLGDFFSNYRRFPN